MLALLTFADVVSPSRQSSSSGTSVWLIIVIVAAVIAIGLALLWLVRTRRRD
jgi:NADH:ubiquinone oxidoreductase subunit K